MKKLFSILLFSACFSTVAQETSITDRANEYYDIIRPEFKGDLAYNTVAFVEKYWRVAGNTGFNKTIYFIEKHLKEVGYVNETDASVENRLTYRIETRQMGRPTWEPVDANLYIVGEEAPLLLQTTNRSMVYLNSHSTQTEAEVVWIKGADEITKENISGKIVFAEMRGRGLINSAVKKMGALGIMTYDMPGYLQPEKNKTSIQFRSLAYDRELKPWGIALFIRSKRKAQSRFGKRSRES